MSTYRHANRHPHPHPRAPPRPPLTRSALPRSIRQHILCNFFSFSTPPKGVGNRGWGGHNLVRQRTDPRRRTIVQVGQKPSTSASDTGATADDEGWASGWLFLPLRRRRSRIRCCRRRRRYRCRCVRRPFLSQKRLSRLYRPWYRGCRWHGGMRKTAGTGNTPHPFFFFFLFFFCALREAADRLTTMSLSPEESCGAEGWWWWWW